MNNSVTGNIVSTTPQLDLEPLAEIRVRQSSALAGNSLYDKRTPVLGRVKKAQRGHSLL